MHPARSSFTIQRAKPPASNPTTIHPTMLMSTRYPNNDGGQHDRSRAARHRQRQKPQCGLRSGSDFEDVQPVITIAGGHVLHTVGSDEGLHAPEVVAPFVDELAYLDQLVVLDPDDPEAT